MSIQSILADLDSTRDAREALYKHFHRNPELSLQEYRTADRIEAELAAYGVEEVLRIGKTGVVAILRNGDGPVVAMRGDTDGLPMAERSGVDYAAEGVTQVDEASGQAIPVAHTCGHDFHIVCLLGATQALHDHRDDWSGTFVAVFQPGEENAAGAKAMVAAGIVDLTVGYAVFIIAFIRVGEKLLQRFGPRRPMLWGCLIVLLSILLLMATHTLQSQYTMLAMVAYSLFGLGLAFYATPSTDAALANLPGDRAGAGSGLYKMASSLGAAFGVAIAAAIFTALSDAGLAAVGAVIEFSGRQDNLAVREAGMVGLAFTALMAIAALVSITIFIPKQMKDHPAAGA